MSRWLRALLLAGLSTMVLGCTFALDRAPPTHDDAATGDRDGSASDGTANADRGGGDATPDLGDAASPGDAADPDAVVDGRVYTYQWKYGTWEDCPVTCGGGTQTREVFCERDDAARVDDGFCVAQDKPDVTQDCAPDPCPFTGRGCEACPWSWEVQGGDCQGKAACKLQPGWRGRSFYGGEWYEACAICNSNGCGLGGPCDWEIHPL
jgi:hypothetical protein